MFVVVVVAVVFCLFRMKYATPFDRATKPELNLCGVREGRTSAYHARESEQCVCVSVCVCVWVRSRILPRRNKNRSLACHSRMSIVMLVKYITVPGYRRRLVTRLVRKGQGSASI